MNETIAAEALNQDPTQVQASQDQQTQPQAVAGGANPAAETVQPTETQPSTQTPEPGTVTGKSDPETDTRANARIRQLVDEKKAALAKAEEQASLAESLRRQLEALKPAPAGNEGDHPDQASYIKAAIKEATVDAQKAALEQQAQQLEKAALQSRNRAYEARVHEFSERAPDYHQVTGNPNLQISPVMADAIRISETGPQIAYYLGKNPSEASRIANLSPVEQLVAVGALSARVSAPEKRVSSAPAPVKTVTGATVKASPDLGDMSYAEYRKARMGSAA
jgi:hypothetical protein